MVIVCHRPLSSVGHFLVVCVARVGRHPYKEVIQLPNTNKILDLILECETFRGLVFVVFMKLAGAARVAFRIFHHGHVISVEFVFLWNFLASVYRMSCCDRNLETVISVFWPLFLQGLLS